MLNQETTREAILQCIARPQYTPIKMQQLAQQIGILKEDFNEFRLLVKRMVKQELVTFGSGHLIFPTGEARRRSGQMVGHFKRNPAGFGFVKLLPLPEQETETTDADRSDDIYISEDDMLDAATGDLVSVKLTKGGRRGRSGIIMKILERATRSFVGSYSENAGIGWVTVDGKIFREPVHVGDAAANRVKDGDKVVLEMLRFPTPWRCGEGVITEIIGPRGEPETDTLSIIRQYGLPERFEDAVLDETRHQAEIFETWQNSLTPFMAAGTGANVVSGTTGSEPPNRFPHGADVPLPSGRSAPFHSAPVPATMPHSDSPSPLLGREDLTTLPILTIDPADARDFDDAISIEILPTGNIRLGVHIADVSHFVQPDTALDQEARKRGNSVYLPDRVIPMLPEILSNGLSSLQPGKMRLTKSVFQELTPDGLCIDVHLCDSVIVSRYRLNYEEVDAFFAETAAGNEVERSATRVTGLELPNDSPLLSGHCANAPFPAAVSQEELPKEARDMLTKFRKIARAMRARRAARGMLVMNLPEIRLTLDVDGHVIGVRREENTESHQMIEEFMVSTNEAVAQTLADENANVQRRVHRAPLISKIDTLTQFLAELGIHLDDGEDRFQLQALLKKTLGTEHEFAVHQAVLRAMQRAEYSPEEEGHYALASECYCHFTSPIRRYADLTVHRQLKSYLRDESPKRNYRRVFDEGKHLSYCEQRAEEAERELTRIKMLHFFKTRETEPLTARIVGVARYGIFVQCEEFPLEGIIRTESLPDDDYRYSTGSQTLSGARRDNSYRLGDQVLVKIEKLDPDQREIEFRLLKVLASSAGKKRSHRDDDKSDDDFSDEKPRRKSRRAPESIYDPHLPAKFLGPVKPKKKKDTKKSSGKGKKKR